MKKEKYINFRSRELRTNMKGWSLRAKKMQKIMNNTNISSIQTDNYNNYIMNFQDLNNPNLTSTQIAYTLNCDFSFDRRPTLPQQQSQMETQDPNFYWKSNYYVTLKTSSQQYPTVYEFQDVIERNCLHEHKQIIYKTFKEVQKVVEINQTSLEFLNESLFQISNSQFADRFFSQLVEDQIFFRTQAIHFKQLMRKRKDWRKICTRLLQSVQKIFYWQLSYLFYKSILKYVQCRKLTKIQAEQIQKIIDQFLQQERKELKKRLTNLRNSHNFDEDIRKIMFSVMLALNSIFINKYYKNKFWSIGHNRNQQQVEKLKNKKNRVINNRRTLQRKLIQQKKMIKNQKISPVMYDLQKNSNSTQLHNERF